MSRVPRIVLPGCPHHVVQRGVRSLKIFRSDGDRRLYLALLAEQAAEKGVAFWAWCLMTNHVHLVAVPEREEALARCVGEAHRRFTNHVNRREGVRGHLFQERFHSFPIQNDEHLLSVIRYIENNPVRARLARGATEYDWSSARHHAAAAPDPLVQDSPIRELEPNWGRYLAGGPAGEVATIRRHVATGRPMGGKNWCQRWEQKLQRDDLVARPVGRPKKPVEKK